MINIICGPNTGNCLYTTPSSCVIYDGPTTTNIGYIPNMTLTEILLLIDSKFAGISSGVFFNDTSSIDIEGLGTSSLPYTATVKVSGAANNGLSILPDGLYAVGGGNLQVTTDLGNTTDNDILLQKLDQNPGDPALQLRVLANESTTIEARGSVTGNFASLAALGNDEVYLSLVTTASPAFFHRVNEVHFTNSSATITNVLFPDGRMSGTAATGPNEFVTLSQVPSSPNTLYTADGTIDDPNRAVFIGDGNGLTFSRSDSTNGGVLQMAIQGGSGSPGFQLNAQNNTDFQGILGVNPGTASISGSSAGVSNSVIFAQTNQTQTVVNNFANSAAHRITTNVSSYVDEITGPTGDVSVTRFTFNRTAGVLFTNDPAGAPPQVKMFAASLTGQLSSDFYINAVPTNFLTSDASGNIVLASIPASTNIYNSNGTLTNNRTVDVNSLSLAFGNAGIFSVNQNDGTSISFDNTGILISDSTSLIGLDFTNIDMATPGAINLGATTVFLNASAINTNFFNSDPNTFLTTDSGGSIQLATVSIPTIYTSDGSLTSNRTISGGGTFSLLFNNVTGFSAATTGGSEIGITDTNFATIVAGNSFSMDASLVNIAAAGVLQLDALGGVIVSDSTTFNQPTTGQPATNPDHYVVLSQVQSIVSTIISTSTASTSITQAFMNANHASTVVGGRVLYTNLSDDATKVLVMTKLTSTTWSVNADTKLT